MAESLRGKGVIAGIAIGTIMMAGQNIDGHLKGYTPGNKDIENQKIKDAIKAVVAVLQENIKTLQAKGMAEQAAILEAHRMLAQDPMMEETMHTKIETLANAPLAVLDTAKEQAAIFEQMDDPYFRERATDIRDVGKRIAKYILGVKEPEIGDDPVILCGHEIEPSVIANIPTDKIAGVILGQGSTTCHAVIIAKARAIPTVVGIGERLAEIPDGACVVIDGERGDILVRPDEVTLADYREKIKQQEERKAYYAELAPLPAVTTDGVRVELCANIGNHMDVDAALTYGAEGVGLFRSEFVFMGRQDIPTEDDQFKAYKEAVEKCGGKICVIRTMDIGGDKPLPYLNIPPEDNPFRGYRALRISLQRRDLFLPQGLAYTVRQRSWRRWSSTSRSSRRFWSSSMKRSWSFHTRAKRSPRMCRSASWSRRRRPPS